VLLELKANNETAVAVLSLKLCKPVNRKCEHKRYGCRQRRAAFMLEFVFAEGGNTVERKYQVFFL